MAVVPIAEMNTSIPTIRTANAEINAPIMMATELSFALRSEDKLFSQITLRRN